MQKETKMFNVDGVNMQFDSEAFNMFFTNIRKKKGLKVLDLELRIGDEVGVSRDAVHSWRFGQNGPADLDIVKSLAVFLEISDYRLLLKERKVNMTVQITERQRDSLKKVYDSVIEFLNDFKETDGFNDFWGDFEEKGYKSECIENAIYEVAMNKQRKVCLVLQKEYIIIRNLDIYPKLEEYVEDDLCNIYNGKLEYAYRFEAGVLNADGTRDTVTTMEDYVITLEKINDLLDPYFN